jgi:glycosyltransferase involved in cell wall biosynthesis
MGSYNGARYLQHQLGSIAVQSRLPDELVICDDGSTDATQPIVTTFAKSAPFPVHLHVNQSRLGIAGNFGGAIAQCKGDLIALADQDDVWFADKLQKSVDALCATPEAGLVTANAEVVNEDLCAMGFSVWDGMRLRRREKGWLQGKRAFQLLLRMNFIMGATTVFRSSLRDLILPIPSGYWLNHDGWIALTVSATSEMLLLDEPVMYYRQHEEQRYGAEVPVRRTLLHWNRNSRPRSTHGDIPRLEGLLELCERLSTRTEHYPQAEEAVAYLRAGFAHRHARRSLPHHRLYRVPIITRELLSQNYHQYSGGALSAMRDLLGGKGYE